MSCCSLLILLVSFIKVSLLLQTPYFYYQQLSYNTAHYLQIGLFLLVLISTIIGSLDVQKYPFSNRKKVRRKQILILLLFTILSIIYIIVFNSPKFNISICQNTGLCVDLSCLENSDSPPYMLDLYFVSLLIQLAQLVKSIQSWICSYIIYETLKLEDSDDEQEQGNVIGFYNDTQETNRLPPRKINTHIYERSSVLSEEEKRQVKNRVTVKMNGYFNQERKEELSCISPQLARRRVESPVNGLEK